MKKQTELFKTPPKKVLTVSIPQNLHNELVKLASSAKPIPMAPATLAAHALTLGLNLIAKDFVNNGGSYV
jgi:hypothetical protein